MVDPFEKLAQGIILQAVEDYRLNDDTLERDSIEKFFRSQWFGILTDLDPEILLAKLRKEKAR